MTRATLFNLIAVVIFFSGVTAFFLYTQPAGTPPSAAPVQSQLSAANIPESTSSLPVTAAATAVTATTTPVQKVPAAPARKTQQTSPVSTSTTTGDQISRIQDPYTTGVESFDQINTDARAALVNILCEPDGSSSLNPISGSGVIIDPRGIVLTNAHVAQYVLLSESSQINLTCLIRTGSPAQAQWTAVVLYIPPIWVDQHASEILEQHPEGTGEHDYPLLYITGSTGGTPLPSQFPYLPIDTREGIGFPGDQVLAASYPAEFLGGITAQYNLYAASSVTTIKQLLTFGAGTPDVLSLGGIIEAQSGSSGGAVVNAWGYLVGIIATTSSGTTTADRDLRAITLSYINSDMQAQSGSSLQTLLAGDPLTEAHQFTDGTALDLIQLYVKQLVAGQPPQN